MNDKTKATLILFFWFKNILWQWNWVRSSSLLIKKTQKNSLILEFYAKNRLLPISSRHLFFYFDAEEKIPFRSLNVYWHSLCICKETHHIIDVLEYRNDEDDDNGTFPVLPTFAKNDTSKLIMGKWFYFMSNIIL